ncbi:short transient receptor potential channel 4-like [Acropora muricata]|uniref:short transient receptor potential channel 4-like n=1 Tax=Acropora muricata TaxID=159855 RepID=UPI0034E47DD2
MAESLEDTSLTHTAQETIVEIAARSNRSKAMGKLKFLDYFSYLRMQKKKGQEPEERRHQRGQAEEDLEKFMANKEDPTFSPEWNVQKIEGVVTAESFCSCRDPIDMAFKVNNRLKELADDSPENTGFLTKLAEQTEDFAVQLIDLVNDGKELVNTEDSGNVSTLQASMLSGLTDKAIVHSQKKFVAHPLLFKRLEMRWLLGLPEFFKRHLILLLPLIVIDTFLTPILLPIIAIAFNRDQKKCRLRMQKSKTQFGCEKVVSKHDNCLEKALDIYFAYFNTPFVIFVKDRVSQIVFIFLLCRVCVSTSSIEPRMEEYLIFIFFCGILLSEYRQFKEAPSKYFKDMWNYIDLLALIVYIFILVLRIAIMAHGGAHSNNRLLEIANYLYGFDTLLLILRFSCIVGLSSNFAPLQLAIFRMCVDLVVILVQFVFIIGAFSVAITKGYVAGKSFVEHSGEHAYRIDLLIKVTSDLMWSLFGHRGDDVMSAEAADDASKYVVLTLYFAFLILSTIMMINILVALLTKTFDNASNNAEIEWKFARAVIENQYRTMHGIVVPFNLITVPGLYLLRRGKEDARELEREDRQKNYQSYYEEYLFPSITQRYKSKYGTSFPLSVEEKMDFLVDHLKALTTGQKKAGQQGRSEDGACI